MVCIFKKAVLLEVTNYFKSCSHKCKSKNVKCNMPCILGDDQAEVQFMSNMDADTKFLVPYGEALQAWLGHFVEDVMDQQVVKTDMKLRHIFNKAVEVKHVI